MTLEDMLRSVGGDVMAERYRSGAMQPVTEWTQLSDKAADAALWEQRKNGMLNYIRQAIGLIPATGGAALTPAEKNAYLASAADPFGLASGALNYISPGTGDAMRKTYEDKPLMAVAGGMATPMPGVNYFRGLTNARNLIKTLPIGGGLAALFGGDAYGAQ
jgi:hypothetical protein